MMQSITEEPMKVTIAKIIIVLCIVSLVVMFSILLF